MLAAGEVGAALAVVVFFSLPILALGPLIRKVLPMVVAGLTEQMVSAANALSPSSVSLELKQGRVSAMGG